jgi:hypothetical protein
VELAGKYRVILPLLIETLSITYRPVLFTRRRTIVTISLVSQMPHGSQHFLDIMADQLEVLEASSRSGPIDLLTADVPAPLPDKEHTVLIKEEQKRNMLKNRIGSILWRFHFFLCNVGCPPMMNQSAQRNAIPCCLSICGHMHLETQVGALADQLNVCLLTNMNIMSHSYWNN